VRRSRRGLVDGVVNDFEDAVVQTPLHRVADVHVRALPNTLETLELLDFRSVVVDGTSLDSAQIFRSSWSGMRVKFIVENEVKIILENAPADNVFLSTFGLKLQF